MVPGETKVETENLKISEILTKKKIKEDESDRKLQWSHNTSFLMKTYKNIYSNFPSSKGHGRPHEKKKNLFRKKNENGGDWPSSSYPCGDGQNGPRPQTSLLIFLLRFFSQNKKEKTIKERESSFFLAYAYK